MRHNFYFSEDSFTVSAIATLLIVVLLTIITFMLLYIKQLDEIISDLNKRISKMEQIKKMDKDGIRIIGLKELFASPETESINP